MSIYAGIDCGTQSTKVVLIDQQSGVIVGTGSAPHELISESSGKREQEPSWWVNALIAAFTQAVQNTQISAKQIKALAVSGQQHGLVALGRQGQVLCPAKLWCDTETSPENSDFVAALGGEQVVLAELGLSVLTGYTVSKILWLKRHHPELWANLACVLLPHDYLNFWLTGNAVMEYGDASGTGLLDIRHRKWSKIAISAVDPSGTLENALPKLVQYDEIIGTVRPEITDLLGLEQDTVVAVGGGDNMMGAIGTGNVKQGIITMSLGTSGTLFAYANQPLTPPIASVANFCSSTNGWLPLICTMNITSSTSLVQQLFQQDLAQFNQALCNAPIGAEGVRMLPFFNGERVPDLPNAKGVITGLDSQNFTAQNLVRAVVEAATFTLRYGLDLLQQAGITPSQIRLTGGGAKSAAWRQIAADIMHCPIICLVNSEAAALGAAIQALWATQIQGKGLSENEKQAQLQACCDRFVQLDSKTLTEPNEENAQRYQAVYQDYLALLQQHYGNEIGGSQ